MFLPRLNFLCQKFNLMKKINNDISNNVAILINFIRKLFFYIFRNSYFIIFFSLFFMFVLFFIDFFNLFSANECLLILSFVKDSPEHDFIINKNKILVKPMIFNQ